MRKKLLRSRTGFEKPESREEAIMQNILGASNVLEPSESNIEEILKSILYNTPYTKEAEFEIEKILLAIKNNGTYDGEGENRDMKILIAILNDLNYTEEAESRIEELFIEWLYQRSNVNVLEGVPPLTFVAKGNPLINYEISGNTVQYGTPTPDSPIMPEGTGERTAQLIPYPFYSSDGEYAGVQFTTDNGRIIANGTLTSGLLYYLWRPAKFPAGTYTMSVKGKHSGATIYFRDTTHNVSVASIYGAQVGDRSTTFTVSEEISAMVYINAGSGMLDFDCTIMLNAGEEALPFEPTNGYKIPISSASTTTPIYLGEVETTRKIKKLVLTGEEALTSGSVIGQISTPLTGAIDSLGLCTHYILKTSYGGAFPYIRIRGNTLWFEISPDGYETKEEALADFKAYLAAQYANGTPVCVWYVLANEETAVVNEPIRKIGDYADTLSMEQAGVEIPTVNGSNTLDVDTTLKPSNIYIEYK